MKKSLVFALFVAVLTAHLISAISTDIKQNYSPAETMIISVSGNFLEPLSAGMIEFRRNNVLLALDYGLAFLNDSYAVWAIAPQETGNYTFIIKGITTTVAGTPSKINFQQNFTVSGNLTSYNVRPGAIFTRSNFTIDIFLFEDNVKSIPFAFKDNSEIDLLPGENSIRLSVDEIFGSNKYIIKVGGYSIPAYIIGKEGAIDSYVNQNSDIIFYPSFISKSLARNASFQQELILSNRGNISLKKITLEYDKSLFSVVPEMVNLDKGENVSLTVSLIAPLNENIFRTITAKYSNSSVRIPISLTLPESNSNIRDNSSSSDSELPEFCNPSKGMAKCTSSENCVGTIQPSAQGDCCVGVCQAKPESSGSSWIIWIILIILLGGAGYLFYRYKKTPKNTGTVEEKIDSLELKKPSVKNNLP